MADKKKPAPKLGAGRRKPGTGGALINIAGAITRKLWGKATGWDDGYQPGDTRND